MQSLGPDASTLSKAIACSFARGGSVGKGVDAGAGPLSAGLWLDNGFNGMTQGGVLPGEWTLLVIHPCWGFDRIRKWEPELNEVAETAPFPVDRPSYLLASPDDNGYKVADVPTFLRGLDDAQAQGLACWWEEQVKSDDSIHFYNRPDAQDILKNIYRPMGEEETREESWMAARRAKHGSVVRYVDKLTKRQA